jgi:hypothetical protein
VLTTQVNELRRDFHNVKMSSQELRESKRKVVHGNSSGGHSKRGRGGGETREKLREVELQREQIQQLRERLTGLQRALGGGLQFTLTGSSGGPTSMGAMRRPMPPPSSSSQSYKLPPV